MKSEFKKDFRCNCPVTSAIDIVGDKWTLVIIKQMLLDGRRSFKDFYESTESIASNILSSRLKMLEDFGAIQKHKLPNNRKTNIYVLTQKGLELTPIIIELALWSDKYLREYNSSIIEDPRLDMAIKNKKETICYIMDAYKEKNWQNIDMYIDS